MAATQRVSLRVLLLSLLPLAACLRQCTALPSRSSLLRPRPLRMAAPAYTAFPAVVTASAALSDNGASRLLRLRVASDAGEDAEAAAREYEPGHVLAVEMPAGSEVRLKGPYTVTRADHATGSVDVVYRVIQGESTALTDEHASTGVRKSALFERCAPGDAAAFGGKFKVPILRGVRSEHVKHVILVSTGVGVGPMIGFVEQCKRMWADPEHHPDAQPGVHGSVCAGVSITLFAGYRECADQVCVDLLNEYSRESGGRFEWYPCLSSASAVRGAAVSADAAAAGGSSSLPPSGTQLQGRSTVAAPPHIAALLKARELSLDEVHFHLIGNGEMVHEWTQALLERIGQPEELVTTEMYFGHKSTPSADAVAAIASGLQQVALSGV